MSDWGHIFDCSKFSLEGEERLDDSFVHKWHSSQHRGNWFWEQSTKAELFNLMKADYPIEIVQLEREVKKVLEHTFTYYGRTFSFSETIEWLVDPLTKKQWPKQYYKIPYQLKGFGDLLYTRRLNMLFHLVPLAQWYSLHKDHDTLVKIQEQIASWKTANPYKMTISWTSSLEVAIRAIVFLWVLQIVGPKELGTSTLCLMIRLLYLHGKFLEENLSVDMEAPNNHLIGESGALAILGISFPEFRSSERWVERGLGVLESQLKEQFYPSGAHREQAMGYHYLVLEVFILVFLLFRRNEAFVARVKEPIRLMFQYISDSSQGVLPPPSWGDTSDLFFLPFQSDHESEHLKLLAIGSVIFESEEYKGDLKKVPFSAMWVLGLEGLGVFQNLSGARPNYTSKGFLDSGVCIMRDGWDPKDRFLAIDCGEQGLGYAGHGHADALSFELSAGAQKLIVDAGTYSYHASQSWRDFFRGTTSHNTVVIDGHDQAKHRGIGAFGWIPYTAPPVNCWWTHSAYDFFDGSYPWSSQLGKECLHRRRVFFIKGEYWLLTDSVHGQGNHSCECFFHFSPGKVSLDKDHSQLITMNDETNLLLKYHGEGLQARVVEGKEDPPQGWVSEGYGRKSSAPVLELAQTQSLPVFFDVILYPFEGAVPPKISVQEVEICNNKGVECSSEGTRGICVEFPDFKDIFIVGNEGQKVLSTDFFTCDGQIIYVRQYNEGKSQGFMLGGKTLDAPGVPFHLENFVLVENF